MFKRQNFQLTGEDMRVLLREYGLYVRKDQICLLMSRFDKNLNNRINAGEFKLEFNS